MELNQVTEFIDRMDDSDHSERMFVYLEITDPPDNPPSNVNDSQCHSLLIKFFFCFSILRWKRDREENSTGDRCD